MLKIHCWYNMGRDDKNIAEKIAIRCCNSGKETMIYMDKMNTTY